MRFSVQTQRDSSSTHGLTIYDPEKTRQQLQQAGKDTSGLSGFVNSFTYRTRGPISSDGFFLTDRESLEKVFPEYFEETEGASGFGGVFGERLGWYGVSQISLYLYNSSNTLVSSLKNLRIAGAYPITYCLKPSGYADFWDGGNPVARDHNFKKQLYIVHIVDERYFFTNEYDSRSQNDGGTNLNNTLRQNLPRTWHKSSEESSITSGHSSGAMVDTLFEDNTKFEPADTQPTNYQTLIEYLHPEGDIGNWDHTLADYPTLCRNIEVKQEDRWENLWSLLDEIGHTIVYDFTLASQKRRVVALGDTSSTSLSSERTENESKILEKAYSTNIKIATDNYHVFFPQSSGRDISIKTYVKASSGLSISYSPEEIGGGGSTSPDNKSILGRLHYRSYCRNEIENHAEELAKLHLKKDLFEGRVANRREVYSGFIGFTYTTKDISSITWVCDGFGPRTILRQDPFHLDYHDFLEVFKIKKKSSFEPKLVPYMPSESFNSLKWFIGTGSTPAASGSTPGSADIADSHYGTVKVYNAFDEATGSTQIQLIVFNIGNGPSGANGRWETVSPNIDAMVQDHQVVISSGSSAGTYPVTHP